MNKVPEAPAEQVVIAQEDLQRLEDWISYFSRLSPRIKLFHGTDPGVAHLLSEMKKKFREEKGMPDDQKIIGWPTVATTAFLLEVDSSLPNSPRPLHEFSNVHFFCFNDLAFGPRHFEWDGEGSETFSL